MKRIVKVRNKTSSAILFGSIEIPAFGTLHIPYADYSSVVKEGDVPLWGVEVDMRIIDYKNVSIVDFGAKGDGISNDTYQLQSAIDYVAGNGGGVVNIPVGVYLVNGLSVSGNVTLVGESRIDSIIKLISGERPIVSFSGGECGAQNIRFVVV